MLFSRLPVDFLVQLWTNTQSDFPLRRTSSYARTRLEPTQGYGSASEKPFEFLRAGCWLTSLFLFYWSSSTETPPNEIHPIAFDGSSAMIQIRRPLKNTLWTLPYLPSPLLVYRSLSCCKRFHLCQPQPMLAQNTINNTGISDLGALLALRLRTIRTCSLHAFWKTGRPRIEHTAFTVYICLCWRTKWDRLLHLFFAIARASAFQALLPITTRP